MLKDKIQSYLTNQRRTVKDLAKHVGMSDTAIRNIYSRDSCELSTLRKIAEFFDISVTDLLEESDLRVKFSDNDRSFNTNADDTIRELTDIISRQQARIDHLTDRLLDGKQQKQ